MSALRFVSFTCKMSHEEANCPIILVSARAARGSSGFDLIQALLRVFQIDQSIVASPTYIAGLPFLGNPLIQPLNKCWTGLGLHIKPKAQVIVFQIYRVKGQEKSYKTDIF
jgi:hypothetical protein